MKVLLINGSPKAERCTFTALSEVAKTLEAEGIETEIVHIGNQAIRGCIACRACKKNGKCVFNDIVNEVAPKFAECDGLVVGTPVYYASANGNLISVISKNRILSKKISSENKLPTTALTTNRHRFGFWCKKKVVANNKK